MSPSELDDIISKLYEDHHEDGCLPKGVSQLIGEIRRLTQELTTAQVRIEELNPLRDALVQSMRRTVKLEAALTRVHCMVQVPSIHRVALDALNGKDV